MLDFAFQHLHLAGAAHAVIAGIRQPDSGAQRRIEQFLIVLDLYRFPKRFYGRLVGHERV